MSVSLWKSRPSCATSPTRGGVPTGIDWIAPIARAAVMTIAHAAVSELTGGFPMRMFRSMRLMLLALLAAVIPASSYAGVLISVGFAPPVLPVYVQPPCPEPGWMWTPGYWAYGDDGYYWVPGTWVPAPYEGALWTPGYWGWGGGLYVWHPATGAARGLLRRRELRLRLHGHRLCGRHVARRSISPITPP